MHCFVTVEHLGAHLEDEKLLQHVPAACDGMVLAVFGSRCLGLTFDAAQEQLLWDSTSCNREIGGGGKSKINRPLQSP